MTTQYHSVSLLAHAQQRTAFLLAMNQSDWLPGWRRQGEIYDAFRNLDRDHSALAADLVAFAGDALESRPYLPDLLIPLGAYELRSRSPHLIWSGQFAGYRRSPQFRQFIRDSGVLDYWQAHGFPPQCRAVAAQDFACN